MREMRELATFTLEYNRTTKNTVRYDYPGDNKDKVPVSAVYIHKGFMQPPYPDKIELTVKA